MRNGFYPKISSAKAQKLSRFARISEDPKAEGQMKDLNIVVEFVPTISQGGGWPVGARSVLNRAHAKHGSWEIRE